MLSVDWAHFYWLSSPSGSIRGLAPQRNAHESSYEYDCASVILIVTVILVVDGSISYTVRDRYEKESPRPSCSVHVLSCFESRTGHRHREKQTYSSRMQSSGLFPVTPERERTCNKTKQNRSERSSCLTFPRHPGHTNVTPSQL